ncbi:Flavin-dependent oxidoreductase, luciferase family (includes alkanesulfonate monooxygenase SsuD and methylene tetrahydromethanopterin reductase) [Amycolatopsis arida]|uniref:Flavin-dependent oxidoreductase, luciferase family (Includes alkanesulfonate monooxygenase SsuD and methylene tetrahydromethanopterin reductase) n=1 Tax=Amycolatopsis arida TaxID=587909 RepID=A0A1I5LTX1_9PSEU|nr:LLM class flavin-dependent oxidoreductase [Amycolatopsis arida]TDX93826.1 alkanesulfonate monooxygenase SsuD/methylene tetrahydromethanopterin reductase-like flavin-dependent oxidoreductase (luciferase family) [Amycolatopsis arida]SFP00211.1 Flavin-dependent oxidoreductase, luciferase family (includes alkanesulfonate monooxygenase SsuD and methylene tetrahydromethanopterin reductase) [Amycolatopsis arida]
MTDPEGRRNPRIGIFLPYMSEAVGRGPDIATAARHAEEVGLDALWVGDNLTVGDTPIVESTLALATAAAVTRRVAIGFCVMLPALRPVAWAAKQVGTLQHLSGHRLELGVGVGGPDEYPAVGVPAAERGRRTDEFLAALPALLRGGPAPVPGVPGSPEVVLAPAAPMPPVWIGGGSAAALRRTARYGDGWFADMATPERLREVGGQLRDMAAEHGRPAPRLATAALGALSARPDPDLAERQARRFAEAFGWDPDDVRDMVVTGTPAQVAERVAEYAAAGADSLAFLLDGDWLAQCDLLAEVRELAAR